MQLTHWYRNLAKLENHSQPVLLLFIRLYWGWQFALSGYGKLSNMQGTVDFFTQLGIPFPQINVYLAASSELFGGLFLIAGFLSRIITLPLIATMVVAYATAHKVALETFWSQPDNFLTQAPFLFLYAAVIVMAFGPGKFSLDYLFMRDRSGKQLDF